MAVKVYRTLKDRSDFESMMSDAATVAVDAHLNKSGRANVLCGFSKMTVAFMVGDYRDFVYARESIEHSLKSMGQEELAEKFFSVVTAKFGMGSPFWPVDYANSTAANMR